MPQTGVPARQQRRRAVAWWDEFERDAFSGFPVGGSGAPARPGRARSASGAHAPALTNGHQANGRRTVTIKGRGAERNVPVARPTLRRHERAGFRPDRAALWAVLLGIFLILVAVASAHAAVAVHQLGVHALGH